MQTERENTAQNADDTYPDIKEDMMSGKGTSSIQSLSDDSEFRPTDPDFIPEQNDIETRKSHTNATNGLSVAAYTAGLLIFILPVAGAVVPLIWACSSCNSSRKNFGAALLIIRVIIWIAVAAVLLAVSGIFSDLLFDILT